METSIDTGVTTGGACQAGDQSERTVHADHCWQGDQEGMGLPYKKNPVRESPGRAACESWVLSLRVKATTL